jgi:hypothetical protein
MAGDNQFVKEYGISHDSVIAVVSAVRRGDRLFASDDFLLRSYAFVWCNSRSLRYFIYRVVRKLHRMIKKES